MRLFFRKRFDFADILKAQDLFAPINYCYFELLEDKKVLKMGIESPYTALSSKAKENGYLLIAVKDEVQPEPSRCRSFIYLEKI